RWLDATADMADTSEPSHAMVAVDDEEFRRLPGAIAVWRAGLALVLGHLAETEECARRALELVPEDDLLGRGAAAALLGLATWARGDLESAHRTFAAGMESVLRAGHTSDVISGTRFLGDIRVGQGRLHEAMRTYEQALQLAAGHGDPLLRGTADLYVGLSE